MTCAICGEEFSEYKGMRPDIYRKFWCKPCLDEFDSIDWDEVYERNMD